ncbi:ribonuclease H-like domain-containing protein [Suillus clintonianus]|uniref:ribonuclease H-like domain-containing protein n=1 Tax=Suillus clintonianus TaxID=1904413 RepID=UPI001B86C5C0|nr:ribonuclease H-like domain-containing protein [Suillus clintonianus]KAG2112847.1 ribonuclease H-like domain-containing protein [Suillus clintonianus]
MQLANPNLDGLSSFMTFLLSLIQLLAINWKVLLIASFVIWSVTVFTRRGKQLKECPSLLAPPAQGSSCQAPLNDSDIPPIYHRPHSQISDKPTPSKSSSAQKNLIVKVGQKKEHRVKPPYDAFLVLDVEATCEEGTGFQWPNEIIEWPVCLMRWKDKSNLVGTTCQLEIVDEFRSFVKPTWRPQLSQFCMDLTGITQAQVNSAPNFQKVLKMFARFLTDHGLIDPKSGRPIQRFCWCSDGPFDVRDFVVKQCFISKAPMPPWLKGDVLDVRRIVSVWAVSSGNPETTTKLPARSHIRSLNIPQQLQALGLPAFQGRLHSGIDDTRNIARVMTELARRGVRLEPNTSINPNRRWNWMGKSGEVLEHTL